jgi:aminoglycoside 3-N-acetyltransferase
MTDQISLSKLDIVNGLYALGLRAGMGLMVHSSLRSFGHVAGGAPTVIEALMEMVTPEGTLLFPSFNHGAPFEPGGAGYYHPGRTATTNGVIPDHFWRMPGVLRSLDPTHAFAAWGKHAQRYTEFHHRTLTMGPSSPLGLLYADDGYTLLLGVNYMSNTFHHMVEMSQNVPCLGRRTEAYPVILPDGRSVMGRTWGWRGGTCPFTDRNRYADEMIDRQHQVRIGSCVATLYRMRDCYAVIARILSEGKAGFPPCSGCNIRPRQVKQTVESDWDDATNQPKPDSQAWTY